MDFFSVTPRMHRGSRQPAARRVRRRNQMTMGLVLALALLLLISMFMYTLPRLGWGIRVFIEKALGDPEIPKTGDTAIDAIGDQIRSALKELKMIQKTLKQHQDKLREIEAMRVSSGTLSAEMLAVREKEMDILKEFREEEATRLRQLNRAVGEFNTMLSRTTISASLIPLFEPLPAEPFELDNIAPPTPAKQP